MWCVENVHDWEHFDSIQHLGLCSRLVRVNHRVKPMGKCCSSESDLIRAKTFIEYLVMKKGIFFLHTNLINFLFNLQFKSFFSSATSQFDSIKSHANYIFDHEIISCEFFLCIYNFCVIFLPFHLLCSLRSKSNQQPNWLQLATISTYRNIAASVPWSCSCH